MPQAHRIYNPNETVLFQIETQAQVDYMNDRWSFRPEWRVGATQAMTGRYLNEMLASVGNGPKPPLVRWWSVDAVNLPG